MNQYHIPVLLKEIVNYLDIKNDGKYIDATVGGGGHTIAILKKGGIVLGIDRDKEALDYTKKIIGESYKNRLILVKGNFKDIEKIALENKFAQVNGILFDLGVSSYQLDNPKRGFSFSRESKLDMRMDKESETSAYELINQRNYEELSEIFSKYGEEPLASEVAERIVHSRIKKEITTTKQLVEIIEETYRISNYKTKIHPATRIFQALRIEVNQELKALKEGLLGAVRLLRDGGKLAVISYHSLEDRITKLTFKKEKLKIITKKPIYAGQEEIRFNRRARSGKLRIAEKI